MSQRIPFLGCRLGAYLLISCIIVYSNAATIFMSPTGSATLPCGTVVNPCAHLNASLSMATSGDTIQLNNENPSGVTYIFDNETQVISGFSGISLEIITGVGPVTIKKSGLIRLINTVSPADNAVRVNISGTASAPLTITQIDPAVVSSVPLPGGVIRFSTVSGLLNVRHTTFRGLRVTANQSPGAAILTERGDVSVEDCTFEDIINTGILNHGAAISLSNVILQYVGVNISRSYFRRIEAGTYSDGGALWSRQGAVNIVGSTFEDNTAKRGAAIAAFGGTTTSITDCTFNNNTAIGDAGAVLFSSIEQAASTSIVGVTLSGNTFIGNRAGGNGGAVLGVDFQASLTGNTFKCNFGHNGGAIAFDRQATILNGQTGLTFQNNVLISNEASSSGGGLYLDTSVGYTIQLGSNTFYRNWAAHSGGAITCNIGKVTWSGDQANIVENTVENGKGAAWYESQCTCLSGQNIYMSGNAASGPNNHTLWWGPFGEPDLKCGSFYAGTVPIDYSRKPSLTCVGDTTIPTLSFPPPFQGFDSVQMQPGGETVTPCGDLATPCGTLSAASAAVRTGGTIHLGSGFSTTPVVYNSVSGVYEMSQTCNKAFTIMSDNAPITFIQHSSTRMLLMRQGSDYNRIEIIGTKEAPITFVAGRQNVGFLYLTGSATIKHVTFKDASRSRAVQSQVASLTLEDVTFSNNTAMPALQAEGGTVTMTRTTFINNKNSLVGFGGVGGAAVVTGKVNITDCRFENNEAVPEGGGAILFYAPQSVNLGVIRNSLFINNKATAGGAIRVVTFSAVGSAEGLLIQDCEFSGNSATTDGGALSFEDSSATLVNSKFSCNSARDGGALMFYNRVATTQFGLNMTENQLSGNVASRNGAALFISSVMTARLNSNLFDFNWGNQNGGAIFCERPTANVLFNGGSIIGNTANSTGGAYYSHNCTCSGAETVAVLNNHARALESTWGGDAASGSRCGSSVSTSLPIQDNLYPGDSESCNPAPQAQTGDTGDTPTRVVSGGSDGDGTPGSSPTGGAVATTTATALLFIAATALLLV